MRGSITGLALIALMSIAPIASAVEPVTVSELGKAIITISQPPDPAPCPQRPERAMIKNADGTYSRPAWNTQLAVACFSPSAIFQEEWTGYPEKGGTFIRRMPGRSQ